MTEHEGQGDTEHGALPKDAPASMSRRRMLIGSAAVGAALLVGSNPRVFAADADKEIRIGFISPRSGPLGIFGHADPYILELARKHYANGVTLGGQHYRVTILDRDSQSSPSRASQLAQELITKHDIQLMLTTSAPETVNPVSDACEAAGVPSLGTVCPLESFFFGRGGKLGQPSPFKWAFDFSFGVEQFVNMYLSEWGQLKTNRKVGVLYPNDADGTAFREHVEPIFEKNGYKVIDPGPYQDGTTDYASAIAMFNRENCQIFNTAPIPPDFTTFWRQAAQLHYTNKVIIAELAKTGIFPGQVTPLGVLGYNLTSGAYWSPVFPYKSLLNGMSSKQLADDYEHASGRQWTQQLGATMSLFDLARTVLERAKDPMNRSALRDVIPALDVETVAGRVNFRKGPYPNTATTLQIGAQWIKTPAGSKFPVDFVTVEHVGDPNVPIQAKLKPYNS
ncbi:MAG TPA: ABC transporter substrate-binding protein [Nevskiaceae bacterium]